MVSEQPLVETKGRTHAHAPVPDDDCAVEQGVKKMQKCSNKNTYSDHNKIKDKNYRA